MKLATCIVMGLVLCTSMALAESTKHRISPMDPGERIPDGIHNPVPQAGGEDIATATVIASLPFSDSDNTCGFLDDYDEACPFTGSTSGDAVYSYTPGSDTTVDIDLCNSGFDTKVYVYENSPATLVDCNDDACGTDGFRSELSNVPMSAGNTYYIVVDGFGGACGIYDLNVDVGAGPCIVDCPPGSQIEGEPVCFDDYKDGYNGGCNSTPNVFTNFACDPTGTTSMCGEYGGYFHGPSGFNYRDTDWYALDSDASQGATFTGIGSDANGSLFGYIDASLGCAAPVFVDFLVVDACDPASFVMPAGSYWFFASNANFGSDAAPCGSPYRIDATDYTCPPTAVENASWAEIKGKYATE